MSDSFPSQFDNSDRLCEHIKDLGGGHVVLSFSRGKDSIAAWLQLRRHGITVTPVHMYNIPDLSFVNESLRYYEKWFGTKIYNMPHPSFYRWLNACVFQPPERWPKIQEMMLPEFDYDDLFAIVKQAAGLPIDTFVGVGVTQNDSLNRRASISKYGAVNYKRRQFYPIYDWNKTRIVSEIVAAGVKLPKEYRLFGRSLDGLDFRFLEPIKRHFPDDYAKIIEWFPLAELELLRYQWRKEHINGKA